MHLCVKRGGGRSTVESSSARRKEEGGGRGGRDPQPCKAATQATRGADRRCVPVGVVALPRTMAARRGRQTTSAKAPVGGTRGAQACAAEHPACPRRVRSWKRWQRACTREPWTGCGTPRQPPGQNPLPHCRERVRPQGHAAAAVALPCSHAPVTAGARARPRRVPAHTRPQEPAEGGNGALNQATPRRREGGSVSSTVTNDGRRRLPGWQHAPRHRRPVSRVTPHARPAGDVVRVANVDEAVHQHQ